MYLHLRYNQLNPDTVLQFYTSQSRYCRYADMQIHGKLVYCLALSLRNHESGNLPDVLPSDSARLLHLSIHLRPVPVLLPDCKSSFLQDIRHEHIPSHHPSPSNH